MATARRSVVISVDQDRIADIDRVAEDLQAVGLDIDRTLSTIGVITGTVDADHIHRLHPVSGVAHVEEQREVGAI